MQNRWGPTRVGPFGLLQPLADGVKFLFKEDLTPPHVYKPLYIAAPLIAVIFALTSIAVIPIGNSIEVRAKITAINGAAIYSGLYTCRSEEHTSELQSHSDLVCRLLLG